MLGSSHRMEEREEDREGCVEWKIYNFLENVVDRKESPAFKLGRHECSLEIVLDDLSSSFMYKFYLNSVFPIECCKTLCKLSVVTGDGDEFIISASNIKIDDCGDLRLSEIQKKELLCKYNNFLPEGVLSLRLSWWEQLRATRERCARFRMFSSGVSSVDQSLYCSIAVLDRSTQTEVSCPSVVKDISTNTDTDHSKLWKTVSDDLESLFNDKTHSDCVFIVGDLQFPVHRAVLSARSVVFKAMLNYDTKENLSVEVEIPDVQPTTFSDVLFYVYSGKVRGLTSDTAVQMYTVAKKYSLNELRDTCRDMLLNNLTIDNICDAAVLAHTHGETDIDNQVIQFITERVGEFMESDKWRKFAKDNGLLVNRLLCSALILTKKKSIE